VHPFPSRRYVLPSCTLTRLSRADSRGLAERLVAMNPWRTLHYRADALAAYLGRPDAGFQRFTVTVSGQAAGLVALRYPWLKGVYLELLALFPPHQGHGLGQELLSWMERQCRPQTKNLWTAVSSFNQPARHFYAKLGFVEVARLDNLIIQGQDEILLRKLLA
jgi:GNAT superfamily N-acetyltransferase